MAHAIQKTDMELNWQVVTRCLENGFLFLSRQITGHYLCYS